MKHGLQFERKNKKCENAVNENFKKQNYHRGSKGVVKDGENTGTLTRL